MGISERKQRHQEELRSRVLAAAEELFVSAGYDNVSMRKIAERIEYSPTTIYRLFANKAGQGHRAASRGGDHRLRSQRPRRHG